MQSDATLEQALDLVKQLSPADKARLIERMALDAEGKLKTLRSAPRKSLRGLWRGLDVSEEDIAEARREMWGSFPRKDV